MSILSVALQGKYKLDRKVIEDSSIFPWTLICTNADIKIRHCYALKVTY